ncbi:MAG: hypothetical protein JHC84_00320 [Solirubrobacteraceae bacterium]|nr:hypothetical protein [Solirubrobacteraceae bacterium]
MPPTAVTALPDFDEPAPAPSFTPLATDIAIATDPPDARRVAAQAIGAHIAEQLRAGRSLFNVVEDAEVCERIGADGRARLTRMRAVESDA